MKSNLSDAVQFIKSLPTTDLLKVTEDELQIAFVGSECKLLDSEMECRCLLFSGWEN